MLPLFHPGGGGIPPVEFRDPGKVSMYVCGPTVYGPPHVGHGRFSLVFDVLRRYLLWCGYGATYWEKVWYEAMDAIGVMRPNVDPHASAFIDRMVEMVGDMVEHGMAYET